MWLLAVFVAVPMIEIALFIQVGGWIGLWPTLLIVLITAIVGTALVRNQGALALRRLRQSLNELRDPTEPLAHGAMILVAGVLLLTPGFFTDAVGLALLLPPVRRAAFGFARKHVKVERFAFGRDAGGPRGPDRTGGSTGRPGRPGRGDVIEGEFDEVDIPPPDPDRKPSGWTRH